MIHHAHRYRPSTSTTLLPILLYLAAAAPHASAGPAIELRRSVIGAGAFSLSDGQLDLVATPGQPAIALVAAGNTELASGFWAGSAELDTCPADLAPPFGVLDFDDVLAFLTAFGSMDPIADLAPPAGVFDFDDILVFLTAFGTGCE